MKTSSLFLPAAAVLLAAALFASSSIAQAPQASAAQQPSVGGHHHAAYVPTNLQVLPKTLTGEQVHAIMEGWAAALGTHCSTCHAAAANGHGLDFADDSKPEKSTARLMYRMVQDINKNYISTIDNSGEPVTCGTCHRGHLGPDPFVAPTN